MDSAIGYISNKIAEALKNRDTRLDHLPFTSPSSTILVLASYLYFVKRGGPSFMSTREPFKLRIPIIIYNLIQIILNAAYVLYGLSGWWNYKPDFNFACQPVNWGTDVIAIKEAELVYCFYCLKLLDLCDTVFFVLKKSTRQVSFLHVYHHFAVLIMAYRALTWSPGGHFIIIAMVNCFVHAVMYTYYLCSVSRPQLKQNVQIKKIVTRIQMVQFLVLIFCFGRPLFNPDCPLLKPYVFEIVLQNAFLFCLFAKFYYRNYCVKDVNKKL